jgi:hypothetical protein
MIRLRHPVFSAEYARRRTFEDGSCFFHALAYALDLFGMRGRSVDRANEIGLQFRARLLRKSSWARFLAEMGYAEIAPAYAEVCSPLYYANDFVINFVSWRLGLNIICVASMANIYATRDQPNAPTVIVAYLESKAHFEPIVRVQEGRSLSESSHVMSVLRHLYGCLGIRSSKDMQSLAHASAGQRTHSVQGLFEGIDPIILRLRELISIQTTPHRVGAEGN